MRAYAILLIVAACIAAAVGYSCYEEPAHAARAVNGAGLGSGNAFSGPINLIADGDSISAYNGANALDTQYPHQAMKQFAPAAYAPTGCALVGEAWICPTGVGAFHGAAISGRTIVNMRHNVLFPISMYAAGTPTLYPSGYSVFTTAASGSNRLFTSSGGTSSGTEPAWTAATLGSTWVDGSITWTCVEAVGRQIARPALTSYFDSTKLNVVTLMGGTNNFLGTAGQIQEEALYFSQVATAAASGGFPKRSLMISTISNDGNPNVYAGANAWMVATSLAWTTPHTYSLNDTIVDSVSGSVQMATTAGADGGSRPTFATTPGTTTPGDGAVTWTCLTSTHYAGVGSPNYAVVGADGFIDFAHDSQLANQCSSSNGCALWTPTTAKPLKSTILPDLDAGGYNGFMYLEVALNGTGTTGATHPTYALDAGSFFLDPTSPTTNSVTWEALTALYRVDLVHPLIPAETGFGLDYAAQVFAPTAASNGMAITSISPTSADLLVGASVTIAGSGFTGAHAASAAGMLLTGCVVNSDIQMTCTAPPAYFQGGGPVIVSGTKGTTSKGSFAAPAFTYN